MRWSKLKQQIEAKFAEELRGRVQLWTTRYHAAHDQFGRSWITLDGREILNMSNYLSCGDTIADGNPDRFEASVFAGYDLSLAMREFLTLSIDEATGSKNPLIRALAVLDSRCGKRRLARFDAVEKSPLVVQMLSLRRGLPAPSIRSQSSPD